MATRNRNVSWFRKEKTVHEVYQDYVKAFGYKPKEVNHLLAFGKKSGITLNYDAAKTLIDNDGELLELQNPVEHKNATEIAAANTSALSTSAALHTQETPAIESPKQPSSPIRGSTGRKKTVPEDLPIHIQIFNFVTAMNLVDVKTSDLNQLAVDRASFYNHFREKDKNIYQDDLLDVLLQDIQGDPIKPADFIKWKDRATLQKIQDVIKRVKVIRQEEMRKGGHEYLFRRLKGLKISEMDKNNDNQITKEEFQEKFSTEVPEDMLDMVFRTIDVNRDGTITALEFQQWQNKMTLKKMEDFMAEEKTKKSDEQIVGADKKSTHTRTPSEVLEMQKQEEDEKTGDLEAVAEEKEEAKDMTLNDLEKRKLQESHKKERIAVGGPLYQNKSVVVEVREYSLEVHDMFNRELEDSLLGKLRAPQRLLVDTDSYLLKYGFFDKMSDYTMIPVTKFPIISLDLEIPFGTFEENKNNYMKNFQQLLEVDPNDVIMLAADKHESMDGFCTIHFILCKMEPEWIMDGRKPQKEDEEAVVCAKIQAWVDNKLAPWRRSFKDEVWLVKTLRDLDFQKLDADNNHKIDFEEFKNYIAQGCVEPLLDCVYKRLFNDLDDNGDGQISPREFVVWKQSYTVKKLLQMFPITYIHAYVNYNCAPADIDLKVNAVRDYFYKCMQYVPFDFEIDCITYCYNDRVAKSFLRLESFADNTKIMFDSPIPKDINSIAYHCYTNRNREFSTYSAGGEYGQGHYLSSNCEYVMNEMIGTEVWTDEEAVEDKESYNRRFVSSVCAVNVGNVQLLEKTARGEAIPRRTDCFCVENIDGKWGSDTFGSISKVNLSVGANSDTDEVDAHSILVDQFIVKDAKRIFPMFIVHMRRRKEHFLWSDNISNVEDCMRSMVTKRMKLSKEIPDKVYCCLTFRDLSRTIELKQIKSKQVQIVAMAFLRNEDKATSFAKGVQEAFGKAEKMTYKLPVELLNVVAKETADKKLEWILKTNGTLTADGKGKKVFKKLRQLIKAVQKKVVIVTVQVNP